MFNLNAEHPIIDEDFDDDDLFGNLIDFDDDDLFGNLIIPDMSINDDDPNDENLALNRWDDRKLPEKYYSRSQTQLNRLAVVDAPGSAGAPGDPLRIIRFV